MHVINKLVYKNLRLNKKRSIVTTIGIILSVAMLVALSTLVSSFQQSMIYFEKARGGDYHYRIEEASEEDVTQLQAHRGFESMYEIDGIGYAKIDGCKNPDKPYAYVMSTDELGFEKGYFSLYEGRFPENDQEIVIPAHLWTNGRIDYELGESITLQVGDRYTEDGMILKINGPMYPEEKLESTSSKTYKVVGKINRPGWNFEDYEACGYTFLTYGINKDGVRNLFARFDMASIRNPEKTFEELSANGAWVTDNYSLMEYERLWPVSSSLRVLFQIASVVALIIVFTSVYCIKNSFDISVSEKIRQYGMLSSIGATKKQIKKSVLQEAAILGTIGIPVGIISGALASFILVQVCNQLMRQSLQFDLIFYPSIWAIICAIILSIVTIRLSAVGSARKASKVSPMEAIRNQKEIKVKAREIRTPKLIKKLWGIGGVVSYKNIKRNRRKYRTTTVSIVICTVTFIVISYTISMMFSLASMHYVDEAGNVSISAESIVDMDKFIDEAKGIGNYNEVSISQEIGVMLADTQWTEAYSEYVKNVEMSDENANIINLLWLDDESFAKYAKECKISDDKGAILINTCLYSYETDQDTYEGEMEAFEYKAGDTIKFYKDWQEKTEQINIPIGGITETRPIGYVADKGSIMLVASKSAIDKAGYEVTENARAVFDTDEANKVQENLEKVFLNNENNGVVSIYNQDAETKQNSSLVVMLGIFAYGFIIVIALIGITNIINTLGTSMAFRSREFATLRSVGMTNKQFNRMIRLESLFTGGKSLVIGITIGLILSRLINMYENGNDTVVIYRPPIDACIICSVVVMGLIYIIIKTSLTRIMKRNVIETIKNENL